MPRHPDPGSLITDLSKDGNLHLQAEDTLLWKIVHSGLVEVRFTRESAREYLRESRALRESCFAPPRGQKALTITAWVFGGFFVLSVVAVILALASVIPRAFGAAAMVVGIGTFLLSGFLYVQRARLRPRVMSLESAERIRDLKKERTVSAHVALPEEYTSTSERKTIEEALARTMDRITPELRDGFISLLEQGDFETVGDSIVAIFEKEHTRVAENREQARVGDRARVDALVKAILDEETPS